MRALAILLLAIPLNAAAALPQAVTLVLHGIGGYLVAMAADKAGMNPLAGVAAAAGVGVAKELYDVNFNGPDAIAWPVGAWLYHEGKRHGWCWRHQQAVVEEWPYIFSAECIR